MAIHHREKKKGLYSHLIFVYYKKIVSELKLYRDIQTDKRSCMDDRFPGLFLLPILLLSFDSSGSLRIKRRSQESPPKKENHLFFFFFFFFSTPPLIIIRAFHSLPIEMLLRGNCAPGDRWNVELDIPLCYRPSNIHRRGIESRNQKTEGKWKHFRMSIKEKEPYLIGVESTQTKEKNRP